MSLEKMWNESLAKQLEANRSAADDAGDRRIRSPHAGCRLDEIFSDELEEDDDAAKLNPRFQALTRQSGPTARVVFWPASKELPGLSSTDAVRRILFRSVTLGSPIPLVMDLLKMKPVPEFGDSAILRGYRLLRLDEQNHVRVGKFDVELDPELGVVVTKGEDP